MLQLPQHGAVADLLDAAVVTAARAPRLRDSALRESLARACPPVTIELGPGERIIGGRLFYSAAWLSPPHAARPRLEHLSTFRLEHGHPEGLCVAVDGAHFPADPPRRAPAREAPFARAWS